MSAFWSCDLPNGAKPFRWTARFEAVSPTHLFASILGGKWILTIKPFRFAALLWLRCPTIIERCKSTCTMGIIEVT